jgi:hypothetical protein
MLKMGFNIISLTSKNGFEGCRVALLGVNLKCGNDNWRCNREDRGWVQYGKMCGVKAHRKKRTSFWSKVS